MFLSMLALAHTPAADWEAQLGKTWLLTGGWTSMEMELSTPTPELLGEDWIGIIFQPDGTIFWEALRPYDRTEGCSNAFAGFFGTWEQKGSHVHIELIELSRGFTEYRNAMIVGALSADTLVLKPTK